MDQFGPFFTPPISSNKQQFVKKQQSFQTLVILGTKLILNLFWVLIFKATESCLQKFMSSSSKDKSGENDWSRWLGSPKTLFLSKRKSRLNNRMVSRRQGWTSNSTSNWRQIGLWPSLKHHLSLASKEPKEWQSFPQLFERTPIIGSASFLYFQSIFMTSHQ